MISDDEFGVLNDVTSTDLTDLKDSKLCRVCGDKSLGYNFGALTCESCKAFFRRNAFKKVPTCVFDNNCSITIHTRRFCSACRLNKCIAINMRKEKILVKNRKYVKNKNYSINSPKTDSSPEVKPETSKFKKESLQIDNKEAIENNDKSIVAFNPTVITSIKENSRLVSLNDSQTREGLARLLNEEEWSLLSNLYQSYINNFINSGSMPLNQMATASLNSLINSSGFIVRRFINYAKQITEFIKLEQPCQIALLKGAVLNSIILRSMVEFDINQQGWVTPQGVISSDVINAAGLSQLYQDYITYYKSFASTMSSDDYLIALSQILCLFSSENMYITQRQIISDIHDKYLVLLKHYLEATYGFNESKPMLISIMTNLIELQNLTTKHGQVLLHADPANVDPLMIEVFNMNISNYFKS